MFSAIWIGLGATAFLDAWSVLRAVFFRVPMPDYGLVGRWIGHMPRGRFFHNSVAASPRVRQERAVGWIAHYLIGTAFAGILVMAWPEWPQHPTPLPALLIGIGSVAAPFLLMQPGMGAGIAARRTPNPYAARRRSLLTHAVFGLGLFLAGWIAKLLEF